MTKARSVVLRLDALVNLALAIALLSFRSAVDLLGIPDSTSAFYPMILGGVLFGIAIALLWESVREETQPAGLGLVGAIAINLSGGVVLILWLLLGDLELPPRGRVILWVLATVLVVISLAELTIRASRARNR